jgi:hypothetical protein
MITPLELDTERASEFFIVGVVSKNKEPTQRTIEQQRPTPNRIPHAQLNEITTKRPSDHTITTLEMLTTSTP